MQEPMGIIGNNKNMNKKLSLEAHNKQSTQKIEQLEITLDELKKEHLKLTEELGETDVTLEHDDILLKKVSSENYEKEMKRHIRQLKQYNELKDLSMCLIQLIADQKQSTIKSVMKEMGIENDDK
ncbi:hypothetical protein C6P40_004611 [Pichia californica]|uniref:Swi5-domain-containing protein n=1 Tax=Pichia californica TaxID=460514 RepID=A0A9P6WMD3_9ASCO|nr:hypothetical protein C6P42_002140 [[Candida] californica]KAG0689712.1 hypothetical protein C6P40_004611 [[Candida] californica]